MLKKIVNLKAACLRLVFPQHMPAPKRQNVRAFWSWTVPLLFVPHLPRQSSWILNSQKLTWNSSSTLLFTMNWRRSLSAWLKVLCKLWTLTSMHPGTVKMHGVNECNSMFAVFEFAQVSFHCAIHLCKWHCSRRLLRNILETEVYMILNKPLRYPLV